MRRLAFSLSVVALASAVSAQQINHYVGTQLAGANGPGLTNFQLELEATGTQHFENLAALTPPSGSPQQVVYTHSGESVTVRHRDDAGGALTGAYRDFEASAFNTPTGVNNGLDSAHGSATSPDMFEFTFDPPVAHWGVNAFDLESYKLDAAVIRAYDSSGTMIYEQEVHHPNGGDGENATNNAVQFVGIASRADNIKTVTLTVGNTEAKYIAGNLTGENAHWLGIVDLYYGSAKARGNRFTTLFANDYWLNVDGTIQFDLSCSAANGISISALDLNFQSPPASSGSIEVYISPDGQNWGSPVATGVVASSAESGLPTRVTLSDQVEIGPGCSYRMAIYAIGLQHAYTVGVPPFETTYTNGHLTLSGGCSNAGPPDGCAFSPRVPNVRFIYDAGGACPATTEALGSGCGQSRSTVYEYFENMWQIENASVTYVMQPTGDGVSVTYNSAASMHAIGSFGAATQLPLADDDVVQAGTLGLWVCDNGWVAMGAGNSTSYELNTQTLLGNPARAFYAWMDMNPLLAGGGIWYEEGPFQGGTRAVVTFDGVFSWGTTQANEVQFVLDFSSGVLVQTEIVFGELHLGHEFSGLLTGYSPAGASLDPGPVDLDALPVGYTTGPVDSNAPLLAGGIGPVQSNNPTPFVVTTSNLLPSNLIHLGIVGLSNPTLPLFVLGMPGCTSYAAGDVIIGPDVGPFPNGEVDWTPLVVPALPPILTGTEFYLQSFVLGTDFNNALGLGMLSSNGLKCRIGQ